MNLNITKDGYSNETHQGELFPNAKEREYAYQSETMLFEFAIKAFPPGRGDGKLNWGMPESRYSRYELRITRHTGKALHFELIGYRNDTVQQRVANGKAVIADKLSQSVDFADLVNRIFADGCQVYHEEEHFPQSVREAMKGAYR